MTLANKIARWALSAAGAGMPAKVSTCDQCDTRPITVEEIMRHPDFRRGVTEYRAGKPPNFETDVGWFYERGRQFAAIAPRDMVVVLPRKRQLNPKAVKFFRYSGIL